MALLPDFGLAECGASHGPRSSSGGMRQRAALARTYLASRDVLLLDEPFSASDAFTKADMHRWFMATQRRLGLSVLFVTHDMDEAALLSDRILVLKDGLIAGVVPVNRPGKAGDASAAAVEAPEDFSLTEQFLEAERQVRALLA